VAGAPPTAGFLAKYFVFYAAIIGDELPLAIIGILASVLGMFYYLRVIWAMYFVEAEESAEEAAAVLEPSLAAVGVGAGASSGAEAGGSMAAPLAGKAVASAARVRVPLGSAIALVISVAFTLLLIVIASPLDSFAQTAVSSLFH
jgi:NADH:ubiquinone oxidoreductase subunit 2 (subunit N)